MTKSLETDCQIEDGYAKNDTHLDGYYSSDGRKTIIRSSPRKTRKADETKNSQKSSPALVCRTLDRAWGRLSFGELVQRPSCILTDLGRYIRLLFRSDLWKVLYKEIFFKDYSWTSLLTISLTMYRAKSFNRNAVLLIWSFHFERPGIP